MTKSFSIYNLSQDERERYFTGWNYSTNADWINFTGLKQSPIALESGAVVGERTSDIPFAFNYSTVCGKALDNGNTIILQAGGEAVIDGSRAVLEQFHFHSTSEHTLDGRYYDLEGHFVHKLKDGQLLVLGVFYEAVDDGENEVFKSIVSNINVEKEHSFDILALLPEDLGCFHYIGSLTTPPLIEELKWYVFKEPVKVSKSSLELFKKYHAANFRPLQPLCGREVTFIR